MSTFGEKSERYGELVSTACEAVQSGLDAREVMPIPFIGPPLAAAVFVVNAVNMVRAVKSFAMEAPQSQPQSMFYPGQTKVYDAMSTGRTVEFVGAANGSDTLILNSSGGQRIVRDFKPGERVTFDFDPGVTVTAHLARRP